MKILIAPNSMKGSLNAFDFADSIEKAFYDCSPGFDIRKAPVADGGDFTGEVLRRNLEATEIDIDVIGPLGKKIKSKYCISGEIAIIEMADASGMKMVESSQLNPMKASTYGTGELIADAVFNKGCTKVFLAIGGSATVDGGTGMMEALGFKLLDENENVLAGNGENLQAIQKIITPEIPENISVKIICDVDNPLLGEKGAANVFGPQKGASEEMVPQLEKGLENWSEVIQKQTGINYSNVKGAGAAGGIAVPLMAFFNAEIVPGADFILSQINFKEDVKWADIVVTGEGKLDSQTLNNKAPFAVAKMSRKYNKPVFAIAGKTEHQASKAFDGIFSLVNGPTTLEFAMKNAGELVYNFSYELAKLIQKLRS
ncbi:glycerate kinase [Maribellus maritimus]|uniref:glycerate kinase n=1 Tax=Maribellus maritimus TaxID=2870838 RepID=UPI001EEB3120|nr:glycerate kinase [Maribellus maritimus]MCG6188365.1 glycerate kinase [Maribellus maritimus]